MPCLMVGLTGGIAAGKTLISQEFASLDVPVIDADVLAHALVEPGAVGLQAIVEAFGTEILVNGQLNRAYLRKLVFADASQRARLESILHPLIWQAMQLQVARLKTPYCLLSIPLLFETQQYRLVDRVLVVDCPVALQRQRLAVRNGFNELEIDQILNAQASREQRLSIANEVIDNSKDISYSVRQVKALHRDYLAWANAAHIAKL